MSEKKIRRVLIIDDPHSTPTPSQLESAEKWIDTTIELNRKRCAELHIMPMRLHLADEVGITNLKLYNMPNIKILPLSENFKIPVKATPNSVCYDVYATEIIEDGDKVTVKLGFATEIPVGWKGVIVPRSSLTKEYWVMQNAPGQVDSDFRGEWLVKFTGLSYSGFIPPFPYKVGDRVAQIYFEPVHEVGFDVVDKLSETSRGEGGFGSTNDLKL